MDPTDESKSVPPPTSVHFVFTSEKGERTFLTKLAPNAGGKITLTIPASPKAADPVLEVSYLTMADLDKEELLALLRKELSQAFAAVAREDTAGPKSAEKRVPMPEYRTYRVYGITLSESNMVQATGFLDPGNEKWIELGIAAADKSGMITFSLRESRMTWDMVIRMKLVSIGGVSQELKD